MVPTAWNRTRDLPLTGRLLCLLSYVGKDYRRVVRVVWVAGFEPAASAFRGRPSTGLTLHPDVEGRGRLMFTSLV